MLAFYSMGAGLGHLSRTLKVINALSLTQTCSVITNNHLLNAPEDNAKALLNAFEQQNITLHFLQPSTDKEAFFPAIKQLITKLNISELYIDCFPVGLYGELNQLSKHLPALTLYLISRDVKWQQYQNVITHNNQFEQVYFVEKNNQAQVTYLKHCSTKLKTITLPTLSEPKNTAPHSMLAKQQIGAYCLVIHSGSTDEICQLIHYAMQKLKLLGLPYSLVLASPWGIPKQYREQNIVWVNSYPINAYIENAEVVVSAAGFNLMHEVSLAKKTHWVLPFERKYDDQFARAARFKAW